MEDLVKTLHHPHDVEMIWMYAPFSWVVTMPGQWILNLLFFPISFPYQLFLAWTEWIWNYIPDELF